MSMPSLSLLSGVMPVTAYSAAVAAGLYLLFCGERRRPGHLAAAAAAAALLSGTGPGPEGT